MPNNEFKIIFIKTFNKLKGNTNRQSNEIKKVMHEHTKNIYKQNRIYKKEQTFLELKKILTEKFH